MSFHPARVLALAALLLVVAAGVLATLEYDKLRRDFSSQVVQSEGRAVRDALGMHFTPPLAALTATGKLLAQSRSGERTPAEAALLARSALADEPGVRAVALLDSEGILAMAGRDGDDLLAFARPATGALGDAWERFGPDMAPRGYAAVTPEETLALGRLLAATAKGHTGPWPAWTGAHDLPGGGSPAMTAVVPAGPGGGLQDMVAFSFSLEGIQRSLSTGLPEGARTLLFSSDGMALRPLETRPSGDEALFVPVETLTDPLEKSALAQWLGSGKPVGQAFAYRVEGATWWGCVFPLRDEDSRTLVGLALPQEALFELLFRGNRVPLLAGAGLGLAVVILAGLAVAARGRRRRNAPFYEDEALIERLIGQGESETLEFKSTLRFNLAAGKPGKEIELAAMKTLTAFMNSGGGVLAVGVDDQGQPLGLEADGFENEDHLLRHFTALFAQHVGIECLPLVAFGVRSFRGRRILLARCARSSRPVILKGGKEEEFYLRAGPSSRKLSLSEFLRHLGRAG